MVLWTGNVNGDDRVKYTGSGNDRDPILISIGSIAPNNTISGYVFEDVNLDGLVKYTGSGNDRDRVLAGGANALSASSRAKTTCRSALRLQGACWRPHRPAGTFDPEPCAPSSPLCCS